jgi:hypothetical protein
MFTFLHPYPLPLPRKRWMGNFLKKDIPQGWSPCGMSFFKINPLFPFCEDGNEGMIGK